MISMRATAAAVCEPATGKSKRKGIVTIPPFGYFKDKKHKEGCHRGGSG